MVPPIPSESDVEQALRAVIDPELGADVVELGMIERIDIAPDGDVTIGLTAGASTPDSKIGETIERALRTAGYDPAELIEPHA